MASSRNIGTQNMLGLGGMLMQGFAPTATGATAFGNMAGAAVARRKARMVRQQAVGLIYGADDAAPGLQHRQRLARLQPP